jgi:hypothetical protein
LHPVNYTGGRGTRSACSAAPELRVNQTRGPLSRSAPCLAWLSLAALWLVAAPLRAQPSPTTPPAAPEQIERDKQARGLFETGRQAYEDGRYRDAWAAFHDAYQLSGRPELLYNIGQTADRLGQDADALKAFRMYVERLPNAPNRRDVENRVRALEDRVSASGRAAQESTSDGSQPTDATPPPEITLHREAAAPGPPPAPAKEQHPARHGFYLRGAIGPGYNSVAITDDNLDASLYGFSLNLDLAAGYALLPGLVVGGVLSFGPTLHAGYSDGDIDTHVGHALLVRIGPFADWYLKRQTAGWHIQGSLTLSILSLKGDETITGSPSASPSGIGLNLGGGYEFHATGDVCVGALAKVAIDFLADKTTSFTVLSPMLLATVTWF